jgi:hypothetical protein
MIISTLVAVYVRVAVRGSCSCEHCESCFDICFIEVGIANVAEVVSRYACLQLGSCVNLALCRDLCTVNMCAGLVAFPSVSTLCVAMLASIVR